jgi:hypothetical protein
MVRPPAEGISDTIGAPRDMNTREVILSQEVEPPCLPWREGRLLEEFADR